MRDDEVPQEGNSTLAGQRKAMYARGADGRLHIVQSAGWEVEEIVTRQAVEDLQQQAEAARQRVLHGQSAPLEYHMYRQRMDVPMLSQVTGLWQWRIRRHVRPEIFARLSPALRARYAEALGMSCAQLDKIE
jgi:hypothetical protein